MNLFGKKKKAPQVVVQGPTIMESISKLDTVDSNLEKREVHLTKQIAVLRGQAKDRLRAKDKRGAIRLLGQCKQREAEVDKISEKRNNISQLKLQLESAGSNKQLVDAYAGANEAIKRAVKPEDADKVEDIMSALEENMDNVHEIDDALTRQIGPVMDDDELAKELDEMQDELNDTEFDKQVNTPTVTASSATATVRQPATAAPVPVQTKQQQTIDNLPAAPTKAIQQQTAPTTGATRKLTQAEQDELNSLEALMS